MSATKSLCCCLQYKSLVVNLSHLSDGCSDVLFTNLKSVCVLFLQCVYMRQLATYNYLLLPVP